MPSPHLRCAPTLLLGPTTLDILAQRAALAPWDPAKDLDIEWAPIIMYEEFQVSHALTACCQPISLLRRCVDRRRRTRWLSRRVLATPTNPDITSTLTVTLTLTINPAKPAPTVSW